MRESNEKVEKKFLVRFYEFLFGMILSPEASVGPSGCTRSPPPAGSRVTIGPPPLQGPQQAPTQMPTAAAVAAAAATAKIQAMDAFAPALLGAAPSTPVTVPPPVGLIPPVGVVGGQPQPASPYSVGEMTPPVPLMSLPPVATPAPTPTSPPAAAAHQEELAKKLMEDNEPQTLHQQENMSIKGQSARHLVMQKLMRKAEVSVPPQVFYTYAVSHMGRTDRHMHSNRYAAI